MKKYSRVTYEVRCQIDAYLQAGFSIPQIATKLGFHKSSIYRELDRNFYFLDYSPSKADELARERLRACRRTYKIKGQVFDYVIKALSWGWSPEQIAKRLYLERKIKLSHECIYQFIHHHPHLRQFLKRDRMRGGGRAVQRQTTRKKQNIRSRPKIANERKRRGDWERDCLYGANRKQLLVCIDRKTRLTLIGRPGGRTSEDMSKCTQKVLKRSGRKVFTITNDNGSEFNKSPMPEKTYYCDPMKPQQRGSVENAVGLIRQWIKRKTDLDKLTDKDLRFVEDSLNFRPRKCLGYRTPFEAFYDVKVALAF